MSTPSVGEFDISKVDKNFSVETLEGKEILWHEITEPAFRLYGLLPEKQDGLYARLPKEVVDDAEINDGVRGLNVHTAGGRIRFSTDSRYIALRYTFPKSTRFPHMPQTGSAGFDLYLDNEYDSVFFRCLGMGNEQDGSITAVTSAFECEGMKSFTLNFPLYNRVGSVQVGLSPEARLGQGKSYRSEKPIVFYGSSITQGGCACRPGNAFPAMVSRWLDCDHVNLGFSGSGLGEVKMMEHIASLHPLIFVYDYDHNAPTPEHLRQTHERGYRIFRKENPEVPVIFVSAPNWEGMHENLIDKRPVVFETYSKALAEGDKNIAFVDGRGMFTGRDRYACTVDGAHPNDLGMFRMAEAIADAVEPFLRRI